MKSGNPTNVFPVVIQEKVRFILKMYLQEAAGSRCSQVEAGGCCENSGIRCSSGCITTVGLGWPTETTGPAPPRFSEETRCRGPSAAAGCTYPGT